MAEMLPWEHPQAVCLLSNSSLRVKGRKCLYKSLWTDACLVIVWAEVQTVCSHSSHRDGHDRTLHSVHLFHGPQVVLYRRQPRVSGETFRGFCLKYPALKNISLHSLSTLLGSARSRKLFSQPIEWQQDSAWNHSEPWTRTLVNVDIKHQ